MLLDRNHFLYLKKYTTHVIKRDMDIEFGYFLRYLLNCCLGKEKENKRDRIKEERMSGNFRKEGADIRRHYLVLTCLL